MTIACSIRRTLPVATGALVAIAIAVPAFAQASGRRAYPQDGRGSSNRGEEVFEWSGRVDRAVELTIDGRRLSVRPVSSGAFSRGSSRVFASVPRQDGQMYVRVLNGRGSVDVVQQPSARNGYRATVRIEDPKSGADTYRVAAYWQAYGNHVGRNDGRGGDRYDRYDRQDRDRDRNGDRGRNQNQDDGYHNRVGSANPYGDTGPNVNQTVLHWSGDVDGDLEIRIANGRISYRTLSGAAPTNVRSAEGRAAKLRATNGVSVVQNQGRGRVELVQQPSAYNGFTTVVVVRDPQGGYGAYNFDVMLR